MKSADPEMVAYVNHGLSASSETVSEPRHNGLRGSNDFIVEPNESSSAKEQLKALIPYAKRKARTLCSRKTLHKRLPIFNWLPKYNSADAVGDLVAGVTVGLTVIPQSLAYANIAHLPAQYGLYGSFLGCITYIVLGSCKDVPMGPTAIASLLTFQATRDKGPEYAILLCFLTGLIELAMGVCGLGFLIDFVSGPVASGFTSAVALIILMSQVKDVLGISASGSTFIEMWQSVSAEISNTSMWDAVLGLVCIAVLLLMRMAAGVRIGPAEDSLKSRTHRAVNKTLWLVGTARNAILVVVCGCMGYAFSRHESGGQPGEPPFKIIGHIPGGFPTVKPPPFGGITVSSSNNDTSTVEVSFLDMVSDLGSGLIVIPLIALLENIAICKAFANGKPVDATQELIAIGVANMANSFVQAYPGTGSLSRSAVNNASGVRTPMGNLYTGALVIVSLLFLTPYFRWIPRAALAAIIIAAVVFMVEVKVVKPMWRTKKSDLVPGLVTFVACLALPLEIGILIGIGVNVAFILYHAARPKISVEMLTTPAGAPYLILTPDRCLIFPSVDYVRNLVNKRSIKPPPGTTTAMSPSSTNNSRYNNSNATTTTIVTGNTTNYHQQQKQQQNQLNRYQNLDNQQSQQRREPDNHRNQYHTNEGYLDNEDLKIDNRQQEQQSENDRQQNQLNNSTTDGYQTNNSQSETPDNNRRRQSVDRKILAPSVIPYENHPHNRRHHNGDDARNDKNQQNSDDDHNDEQNFNNRNYQTSYATSTPNQSSISSPNNVSSGQQSNNHLTANNTTATNGGGSLLPVVLDCSHVYGADYTSATALHDLMRDFEKRGQSLFFYNLKSSVCQALEAAGDVRFEVYYRQEDLDDLLKKEESLSIRTKV